MSIPFLLPYGVIWLYVIVALSSALAQFFDPAQASILPELASDEELTAANSMITISQTGAEVLGVALAGLTAACFEIAWAFSLDGLTFFLGAGCLLLLRVPPIAAEEETSVASIGRNLRAGVQYVGQTGVLRSLVLVFIPIFLLFGNALNLPFVLDAVGLSEFEYGLVEGISMVGFVLGSLLMAGYAERIHAGQWISLSIIGMALAWVAFGLSGTIGALLLFGGLQTFLNAFSYIGRTTLIQRSTPRELRGRVFSVFFVTRDCFFMVGMALVALGDQRGHRWPRRPPRGRSCSRTRWRQPTSPAREPARRAGAPPLLRMPPEKCVAESRLYRRNLRWQEPPQLLKLSAIPCTKNRS